MINQINIDTLLNQSNLAVEKITDSIYKIDGEVIEILAINYDLKLMKFRHNHNTHEVQFKNNLDLTLDKMGIKRSFDAVDTNIKAPMPGKVLQVMAKPGDEIKKGDGLLILEAMKMENIIKSDFDCQIKAIHIDALDNVEKNQLLIELEVV